MIVELKKISDREIQVNAKPVIKNMDDVWVDQTDLNDDEEKVFKRYLKTLENSSSSTEIRIFHHK